MTPMEAGIFGGELKKNYSQYLGRNFVYFCVNNLRKACCFE
jgi:hypothetical protein